LSAKTSAGFLSTFFVSLPTLEVVFGFEASLGSLLCFEAGLLAAFLRLLL